MSDMEQGELARRLRAVEVPGTEAMVERALAAEEPARRRRWMPVAVVAAVLAALVAAIPIAQATSSPVATWILQLAGIPTTAPPSGAIRGVSATASGHTVTVLTAYGDAFHTVVVIYADKGGTLPGGRGMVGPYTLREDGGPFVEPEGISGGSNGQLALAFRGLAPGLHHLTLTIQDRWVLHFPLRVAPVQQPRANPAAGTLHGVGVTIRQAGGERDLIMTTIETRGATMDQLSEMPNESEGRGAAVGPDPLKIRLFGPSGQELQSRLGRAGAASPDAAKGYPPATDLLWDNTWPGAGKGTYRLVLTYKGDTFQSTFTIH